MGSVRHGVLTAVMAAALLLVVAGPVYGFDVPRLSVVAVGAVVLLATTAPELPGLFARLPREARWLVLAALAFVLWVLLSVVFSGVPRLSLLGQQSRFVGGVALVAPVLLVPSLPVVVPTLRQWDRVLGLLAAMIAAGALYAVVQFLGLDPMPWAVPFGGRPVSFFGNSNFVGAVLCLGVPLAVWIWTRGGLWRSASVALLIAVVWAILAAQVRLGMVAAAAGLAVTLFVLARLPWPRLQTGLVAAVPIGGVFAGLGVVAIGAAIGDRNGLARVSFWQTAGRMWAEAPLLGQGIGRFEPAYRRVRTPSEVTVGGVVDHDLPVDSSHAFVIDLAATGGTPAVLLWLSVLVLTGLLLARLLVNAQGWVPRVRVATLSGMLGAHAVQSSVSVPIITTVWLGWFLVALTLALVAVHEAPRARRGAKSRRSRVRRRWTRTELVAVGLAVVLALPVALSALRLFNSTRDVGTSRVMQSAEQFEAALPAAQSAAQRTPWWPQAWHETSRSAVGTGDTDLGLEAAVQAVEIDDSDRLGLLLLRDIDSQVRSEADALVWYEQLLLGDPNGLDLNLDVLRVARNVGDDDLAEGAIEVLDQILEPGYPQWELYVSLRDAG